MRKNSIFVYAVFILSISNGYSATPDYLPLSKSPFTHWDADSFFLGALPVVLSDSTPIIVKWKATYTKAKGELFFVVPGFKDSLRFLFHNTIDSFPNEIKEINLGFFPANTELFFMYTVEDTSWHYKFFKGKRYYSGQNREGIDTYLSEIQGVFDKRWAAAGKIDSSRVEIGFEDDMESRYNAIIFEVGGVTLKKE